MAISQNDAYHIARALAALPTDTSVPMSDMVKMLLASVDLSNSDVYRAFSTMLHQNGWASEVLGMNPKVPPTSSRILSAPRVPNLPSGVSLSKKELAEASKAGLWLDEALAWASARSPLTPKPMLQSGLLAIVGIIIARRLKLQLSNNPVYTNLYVLWVAPTSYFAKSTGLSALEDMIRAAAPHLLIPSNNTSELLLAKLAGKLPANYSELSRAQQQLEDAGRRFAGQRGMLIDEATKTLFSGKKYMEGYEETFMELYDPKERIERELRSDGVMIINQPSLSIVGATTPSRLSRMVTDMQWEDGAMPRFALVVPDVKNIKRPRTTLSTQFDPPEHLVRYLKALYARLPEPAQAELGSDDAPSMPNISVAVADGVLERYNDYYDALREMLAPDKDSVDDRLRGNYSRLPTMALKVAIILAALDWNAHDNVPTIQMKHWYRAQDISENWRAMAHELIWILNDSQESKEHDRVLQFILSCGSQKPTARQIMRALRLKKQQLDNIIAVLKDSGELFEVIDKTPAGRSITVYDVSV